MGHELTDEYNSPGNRMSGIATIFISRNSDPMVVPENNIQVIWLPPVFSDFFINSDLCLSEKLTVATGAQHTLIT